MYDSHVQEHSSEASLPPHLQALLDGRQPLPPDVQFFPMPRSNAAGAAMSLLAGVVAAAAGIGLVVLDLATNRHDVARDPLRRFYLMKAGGVVLVVALGLVAKGVFDLVRAREQASGSGPRHGVFLTPDTLLVRAGLDVRTLPRAAVTGCETGEDGSPRLLWVNAAGETGQTGSLDESVDREAHPRLQAALGNWIGGR